MLRQVVIGSISNNLNALCQSAILCIMWLTGSSGVLQVLFASDASKDSQVHALRMQAG